MPLLSKDLRELEKADIDELCADQVSEGLTLELKEDLPARDGQRDPWHTGKSFSEYARNQIAEEIVAFANTFGGTVVLGVTETSDKPSRADKPNLLPRVHDLERSLRQSLQAIIDPPLATLESKGVVFDDDGNGVVLIRVGSSRRKPHRSSANREAYIRRMDESVKIGMREIQELTIQSLTEGRRVDETIERMRSAFPERLHEWLRQHPKGVVQGAGLQFVAVPTSAIDLGRVAGRPELVTMKGEYSAHSGDREYALTWPFIPGLDWTPGLRRVSTTRGGDERQCEYLLTTQGICELVLFINNENGRSGFFVEWLVGALSKMLLWIDAVRAAGDVGPVEYALAPQIVVLGNDPAHLALYGATQMGDRFKEYDIPVGKYVFPINSVASRDEFPKHLARFDEDIWNLVEKDFSDSVSFRLC